MFLGNFDFKFDIYILQFDDEQDINADQTDLVQDYGGRGHFFRILSFLSECDAPYNTFSI